MNIKKGQNEYKTTSIISIKISETKGMETIYEYLHRMNCHTTKEDDTNLSYPSWAFQDGFGS